MRTYFGLLLLFGLRGGTVVSLFSTICIFDLYLMLMFVVMVSLQLRIIMNYDDSTAESYGLFFHESLILKLILFSVFVLLCVIQVGHSFVVYTCKYIIFNYIIIVI